jgi:hypothetical protein
MYNLPRAATLLLATLLATPACPAEDLPPQAAQLESAGFKVHRHKAGGYSVDFGKVKVLDDASIANIAALREVRELSGTGEGVDNAVLAKLVKAAPDLETFFVNGSTITDEGLTVLAKLPKLRHLGVHHGPKELKGKGLLALKDNANFKSVEFGGMQSIDDESVGYLAELPHLRAINIYHTMNTRASLPLLVKKNPSLEKFSLNPHFDPKRFSAEDIAMLAPLKNLSELLLNDMVLPYENGLSHLTALKGLKKVSLEWSIYKDEDLAKLKAALPGVEIISTNRAKPEELAKWNERVEAMKKEATKKP